MRVHAAGVAFLDLLMREGTYPGGPKPPFTPGYDLVGEVESTGAGVRGLQVGQRVAALTVYGSYTDWICLPADDLVPVPDGLDAAEAVSLVLNYVTAYQLLHRAARVAPGERILVQGAAGGVGTAILQLGRLAGLEVFGTASAKDLEVVASLGATPIDRRRDDFVAVLRAAVAPTPSWTGSAGRLRFARYARLADRAGSSCSGITPRSVADGGRWAPSSASMPPERPPLRWERWPPVVVS
jgi:NADPH2:quinone reductase